MLWLLGIIGNCSCIALPPAFMQSSGMELAAIFSDEFGSFRLSLGKIIKIKGKTDENTRSHCCNRRRRTN